MKVASSAWLIALVLGGCEAAKATTVAKPTGEASAERSETPPSAQAVLDRLDARAPVPLLPMMANHQKQNMRDHLAAVQEIIAATSKSDFSAVEKAVSKIAYSETMGQMCTHMGAGAPGFTERAIEFHHNADKIGDAARAHDGVAVLSALGQTLSECTSCHAAYKQNVVAETTWAAAAGQAVPTMHHLD
jgi:hypothetical protein